jgi:hypothetical protein
MNDFVNPKSMMTPGAAGALVMFLSNAVCFQFPDVEARWLALGLSFVIGALVVAATKPKVLAAAGFWLVNSLVIFAVAVGSAGEAAKATSQPAGSVAAAMNLVMPSAYAQSAPSSTPARGPVTAAALASLQAQLEAANARLVAQQAQLDAAHQALATRSREASASATRSATQAPASANSKRFFKTW